MFVRFAALLVFLGMAMTPGYSQSTRGRGIPNDAQRYCATASDFANENPDSFLYFSAVAKNRDPALDKWHRLPSSEALRQASSEKNSTAELSMRDGSPAVVFFTFENQFGDAEEFAQYCYRPDGSLAFIHSDLKSYHANREVIRDAWFGPAGTKVFTDSHVHDLRTQQVAKLPPDFWDLPPPEFMHVSDLPFAQEIPASQTSHNSK